MLLDRWCAGDAAAGNELLGRHFASLYGFFEHKTDGDPDDLVQETLFQCIKGREAFQRQSSFRTYLFAIARHVLFQHWRKRAAARATLDFDEISIESLSTSAGTRLANRRDGARLIAALLTLPLDQQILLELYYWEDFDRERLAEIFEVDPATIGSRLFRARQALKARLDARGGGPEAGADFDGWARSRRGERDA